MENSFTNSNIDSIQPKYNNLIIIIPTYNEELFLGSYILKLKKYTETIIVVDDSSKDDTIQIAKSLLNSDYILKNNTNLGFVETVKIGLNKAKSIPGQYILIFPIQRYSNIDLIDEVMTPLTKNNELDLSLGIYQNVFDNYKSILLANINSNKKPTNNLNNIAMFIFKKSAVDDNVYNLKNYDDISNTLVNFLLTNKKFSLQKISSIRPIRKAPIVIKIILYILIGFILSLIIVNFLEWYLRPMDSTYILITCLILGVIVGYLSNIQYRRYIYE